VDADDNLTIKYLNKSVSKQEREINEANCDSKKN